MLNDFKIGIIQYIVGKQNSMKYFLISLSLIFFSMQGCQSLGNLSSDNDAFGVPDSTRLQWEKQIEAKELGKADYISGELVNIDNWPFPANDLEVFRQEVIGNPYELATCAHFIRIKKKKDEDFRLVLNFTVDTEGSVKQTWFINEAGPCSENLSKFMKSVKFMPAIYDSALIPMLVIYPMDFDYAYGTPDDDSKE